MQLNCMKCEFCIINEWQFTFWATYSTALVSSNMNSRCMSQSFGRRYQQHWNWLPMTMADTDRHSSTFSLFFQLCFFFPFFQLTGATIMHVILLTFFPTFTVYCLILYAGKSTVYSEEAHTQQHGHNIRLSQLGLLDDTRPYATRSKSLPKTFPPMFSMLSIQMTRNFSLFSFCYSCHL